MRVKKKCRILLTQLLLLTDYNTKINEIEKKTTDHDHDKYITTPEFNKVTASRLAQANLVKATDFDNELIKVSKNLTQTKQKMYFSKINLKNYRHLIQSISVVKVILKAMVLKSIQYFRQHIDFLKRLVILMIIFYHEDLKDCPMKVLSLFLHLIMFLMLYETMLVLI